jgi:hypothetical protein
VQRVRTVSQGFLKLPVDAEAFKSGFLSPEPDVDPVPADRAELQRGHLVDQEMGIRAVGPAGPPVVQPSRTWRVSSSSGRARPAMTSRRLLRSTSSSCRARNAPARAAWIAARAMISRVGGPAGAGNGPLDLVVVQRLDELRVPVADSDAAGRVAEHPAFRNEGGSLTGLGISVASTASITFVARNGDGATATGVIDPGCDPNRV